MNPLPIPLPWRGSNTRDTSLSMTELEIILDFIPLRGTLAEPTKRS